MERHKFIYLTGLLPVLACVILLFFWILTGAAPLGWLGLILSLLGVVISLLGCYHAYQYYNDKKISDRERKLRRKHFLWHTTVLSIGLVFSWQSVQYFRRTVVLPGQKAGLVITVKNTSQQVVKDIQLQVGAMRQTIQELPVKGSQEFQTNIPGETELRAQVGTGANAGKAIITVGPENHAVLLLIDPMMNLIPEIH